MTLPWPAFQLGPSLQPDAELSEPHPSCAPPLPCASPQMSSTAPPWVVVVRGCCHHRHYQIDLHHGRRHQGCHDATVVYKTPSGARSRPARGARSTQARLFCPGKAVSSSDLHSPSRMSFAIYRVTCFFMLGSPPLKYCPAYIHVNKPTIMQVNSTQHMKHPRCLIILWIPPPPRPDLIIRLHLEEQEATAVQPWTSP